MTWHRNLDTFIHADGADVAAQALVMVLRRFGLGSKRKVRLSALVAELAHTHVCFL